MIATALFAFALGGLVVFVALAGDTQRLEREVANLRRSVEDAEDRARAVMVAANKTAFGARGARR